MEKDNENEVQPKKAAPVKKQEKDSSTKKKDEKLVKNTIEINPMIDEAVTGTAVVGWGRMNPITTGHEKLVNKITSVAKSKAATPVVYLTHSQDKKKNPLSYDDKVSLAKRAFGPIIQKSNSKTIIQVMQELQKRFKNIVLVVGSDRVNEFETLLNKYNGKDYTFDSIEIVSAGDRDPDAEDVTGMSASKMRSIASTNTPASRKQFASGLPAKLKSNSDAIFDMVRAGLQLAEELESAGLLDEAVLNIQQRRKRALAMRKYKNKIMAARKRMMKRPATKEKLKVRARKKAIQMIRNMVAGKKGKNYMNLSPSEKAEIDKRVEKRKRIIDRLATRLLPKMKRADMERIASRVNSSVNEEFEQMFETIDNASTKRHHEARKKDGSMKYDKRFRAFKSFKEETIEEIDSDILNIIECAMEINDVSKDKILAALDEKAEKHDIPLRNLMNVYNNALAETHDYDMTPEQYAFSCVNVYLANIKEGVNDPGIFKAVFLAGGPGSGKSFIVGKTALTTLGLKLINSDDAFEHQLAKVGLSTTPEDIYSDLGQSVRGKAKALTAKRQQIAMAGRLGLVIDGTGKDYDKIKKQADMLRKVGYEVAMIFVNTDLETAQARNKARTRTLPEQEVEDMWNAVQRNIGKFQNYFGQNFVIVDNSTGANYEGAVNSAYKKMMTWTKMEPKSSIAKKWIKDEKAKRNIKEAVTSPYTGAKVTGPDDLEKEKKHYQAMRAKQRKKELDEAFEDLLNEKLDKSDDMGKWIDDFAKSDAPQFKGKSKEKRRQMAIAAKLSSEEVANNALEKIQKAKHQRDLARKARDKGEFEKARMHDKIAFDASKKDVK